MKKLLLLLFPVVVCFSTVFAQDKDTLKAEDILNMSFSDLMNTKVVSASKMEQQIKNVSATVQVVTAEQIRDRSYLTLEEALGDLPGFQFRNIVGFNSYVFMRGAPSQNNLILLLVDGQKVNELNSGGFYAGGQYNMSDIERIEVVYGPASALYGTNAVSGVINIIPKRVEGGKKGSISLMGGNFNTGIVDFNVKNYYADKDIGYSVSGMYKTTEKADLRGAKGDNNWTDDMENFENDLSLSARIKVKKFDASILFQEKRSSMTTNYKSVGEKYLDRNSLWDITFLNGFIKYSNSWREKISFLSTLYYSNSTVKPNTIDRVEKVTSTTSGNQVGYYRPNQLVGMENQLNCKLSGNLMLIGGIVGEIEQLSDGFSVTNSNSQYTAPPSPHKPEMSDNNLLSYYLQADYKIFEKLSFTAGIRQDFSSYYGQVFTPRTGLVYNSRGFTAKLLYNTAFRAPKPWDYDYGEGNHNLNPEKMQSFELFLSYSFLNNLSVGTSLYRNHIDDKLILATIGDSYRWANENELNTCGIEFYANYTKNNVSAYANYTYTDSYEKKSAMIPEISRHMANAGASYSITKKLKVDLRVNYCGARNNLWVVPSTGDKSIGDAFILNGNISFYNFKGFDFHLKVNNLLDEVYYHTSNRFAGRYRQPQRSVYLMVTYNLFR